METISQNNRKANKDHICNWCEQKIVKGTIYSYSANVDEGTPYIWKNHIYCSDIAHKIGMWDDGDGITTENFQESVKCHYQDVMSKNFNEEYESIEFKYPSFAEQLNFILDFYKINK